MILGAFIGVFLVMTRPFQTEPSTDLKEEKETESSEGVGSI